MLRSRRQARGGIVLSCTAIVSVLAMASVASAGIFPWSPSGGGNSTSSFTYSGGKNFGDTTVTNILGSPTILDSASAVGFEFNNVQGFQAVGGGFIEGVAPGIAGVAENTASAFIFSQVSGGIEAIVVQEFGTWSIPNNVNNLLPQDVFNFTLAIGLQPISPPGGLQNVTLSDTIIFDPDGTWTATGSLIPSTVSGSFFNIGTVTVTNILGTPAAAPAGSTFSKGGSTLLVPEPTTAALLLAGFCQLALRRRRRS